MQVPSGPVIALWLLGSLVCQKKKAKNRAYADQFDIAYNGTRLKVFMSQIELSLPRYELVNDEVTCFERKSGKWLEGSTTTDKLYWLRELCDHVQKPFT